MKRINKKKFDYHIEEQLSPLKERNNYKNLLHIFFDYFVIFLCIFMSITFASITVYIASVILIGSRLRALENLTHEASHFQLFKNRMLNDWMGMLLCAFPAGNSLYTYRKSHLKHHSHFGDDKIDPDLIRYKYIGIGYKKSSRKQIALFYLKIFLFINLPRYFMSTIKEFIYTPDSPTKEKISRIIFYLIIFSLTLYFNIWYFIIAFWLVPFLTSFQIIRQLSEISEHGGLYQLKENINMTRNNLYNPLLTYLIYPHNDNYHLVHHLFASIPHFNLKKAHNILLQDQGYSNANHCSGYFFTKKSAISTMLEQEEISI